MWVSPAGKAGSTSEEEQQERGHPVAGRQAGVVVDQRQGGQATATR